jgi:hypothetical protein
MIGENAKPKIRPSWTTSFTNLSLVGHAFSLAEQLASKERPLLVKPPMNLQVVKPEDEDSFWRFSQLKLNSHELLLGMGDEVFYQVPILQLAEVGDVMLGGTMDSKGEAEKFEERTTLGEHFQEEHKVSIEKAQKLYAVAILPKGGMGENLFIACGQEGWGNSPIYFLASNGFIDSGLVTNRMARLLLKEKGKHRYLKMTDILSDGQVQDLEEQDVYPGVTLVMGRFQQERRWREPFRGGGLLGGGQFRGGAVSKGVTTRGGDGTLESLGGGDDEFLSADTTRSMDGDAGRVGVEVGRETDAQRGSIKGDVTAVDVVLALHFLAVDESTTVAGLQRAIGKLLP